MSSSELQNAIANFEYAVDILSEYTLELKNSQESSLFILGKINAALSEVNLTYDCLSDVIYDNSTPNNDTIKIGTSDTISYIGGAADYGYTNYTMYQDGDMIGISKDYLSSVEPTE